MMEQTMTSKPLTDTQRIVLSHASMRIDGAVLPLPASVRLNSGAASALIRSLVKRGLVSEGPAVRDDTLWRENSAGDRATFVITDEGCEAIGVEAIRTGLDQPAPRLSATDAISRSTSPASPPRASQPRAGTKLAILIEALSRIGGATIAELMGATGWQAHSIRGAMSGALKRDRGLVVTSEKPIGSGRVYRLATLDQAGAVCGNAELVVTEAGADEPAAVAEAVL